MKKLLLIIFLTAVTITSYSQSFWRPISNDLFKRVETTDRSVNIDQRSDKWLFRPVTGCSGILWNWDKERKTFNASTFDWFGIGVGVQHFIDNGGTPFNNYGANALVILGENISGAVTFSGFGILNLGATYNFATKQPGILTGIQIRF